MPRDFIGYNNNYPDVAWPDGKRLALSIVVNYEEGAERAYPNGDDTQETGTEWGRSPVPDGTRDLAMESMYEYGSRVGVWRILDVLERHSAPATFFAAAKALEIHPNVGRTADIGHRIGCQMRAQVAKILGGEAPRGCGKQGSGPRATASAASANRDSDKDGIPDAEEIRRGTDPYSSDTDHDGVSDKDEIEAGLNPRDADTDHDGLRDGAELDRDSYPFNPDTDGDHKRDGDDKDPTHYNASWTDAIKGATCGDSDFLICPDKDDPVRASTEYLTGQLLSGVFAIGDVRDIINALAHGKVGDALWSAVGFVPAAGDAAKFGKKINELIKRFPARKGELLSVLKKLLPSKFERVAIDAATGGGYSALQKAGVSTKTIDRLIERGNDLKKLANNARLSERTLSASEAQAIETAVAKHWPASRRSEGFMAVAALLPVSSLADSRGSMHAQRIGGARPCHHRGARP